MVACDVYGILNKRTRRNKPRKRHQSDGDDIEVKFSKVEVIKKFISINTVLERLDIFEFSRERS